MVEEVIIDFKKPANKVADLAKNRVLQAISRSRSELNKRMKKQEQKRNDNIEKALENVRRYENLLQESLNQPHDSKKRNSMMANLGVNKQNAQNYQHLNFLELLRVEQDKNFSQFVEFAVLQMDDTLKRKWLRHINSDLIQDDNEVVMACTKDWFERM